VQDRSHRSKHLLVACHLAELDASLLQVLFGLSGMPETVMGHSQEKARSCVPEAGSRGAISCRERLGGLLKYYSRAA